MKKNYKEMYIDSMVGRQLTEKELNDFSLEMGKRHREKIKEEVRKFYPRTYKVITKWSEKNE